MLSNTAFLVVGGALLTGLLGALVFGSNGTAEDQRMREERKLLRALEAQRRIRDAQLMRDARRRGTRYVAAQPPAAAPEPEPVVPDEDSEAERRAAERERKREEKAKAAALKSEREAEKRAQRRAEQERKSAARAAQAELRAAERRQEQEAKAARKLEQAAPPPPPPPPEPVEAPPTEEDAAEQARPLSELPLFSWANGIDDADQPGHRGR